MDTPAKTAGGRVAPLTVAEAQRAVDASILALGGYWPPLANLARLFEECGELARVVNQQHGPKQMKAGEAALAAREELGDALYVLLVLANSLQVDAEEALREALDKVARRIAPPETPKPQEPGTPPRETDL
ncbi:MAG TPA: MazG nucleotide pyrophosphohydrolase domain-containing protein [Ktedonobacterales bacterium]